MDLCEAARVGDVESIRRYVEDHADLDLREHCDSMSFTPVHVAAEYGQADALRVLLEACGDPNIPDGYGLLPMYCAAIAGQVETAQVLLEFGSDPDDAGENESGTPLMIAAEKGHAAVVKVLLDANADPNARGFWKRTPLIRSLTKDGGDDRRFLFDAKTASVVSALLSAGANPNLSDKDGMTAAHYVASHAGTVVLRLLLSAGADVYATSRFGRTPLHHAQREAAGLLLRKINDLDRIPTSYFDHREVQEMVERVRDAGGYSSLRKRMRYDFAVLLASVAASGDANVLLSIVPIPKALVRMNALPKDLVSRVCSYLDPLE